MSGTACFKRFSLAVALATALACVGTSPAPAQEPAPPVDRELVTPVQDIQQAPPITQRLVVDAAPPARFALLPPVRSAFGLPDSLALLTPVEFTLF